MDLLGKKTKKELEKLESRNTAYQNANKKHRSEIADLKKEKEKMISEMDEIASDGLRKGSKKSAEYLSKKRYNKEENL